MQRTCESIFHEARSLTGDARDAYLRGACGDDVGLRSKVEALLTADAAAVSFLETVEPEDDPPTADHVAAEPDHATSSESAGQMIGRYKLLQLIGEGGFGSVWLAEQREPVKRRVALKIIKLGMDTRQVIARFEAERQALAMMDHPNIAKVLDAGCTDTGRPYFVMEYVRGIGILEYCDKENVDTAGRLHLFIQVCRAIQHAHQKGIIHRDIKPSNVMITLHDGVPVPKVIDFGVAKATNTELTQKTLFTAHRQVVGTPAYMSPEQAEMSGLDIDTRSDIYSLGVLLYELLTGTTPFDSQELMSKGFAEMMRIIREVEPHKPSTRLSTLGETATLTAMQRSADPRRLGVALRGDLDWIVMKCLEKDRTRRYETANGVAADIQRHLDEEPVIAGPPSQTYRLGKFLKRNRVAASASAAVIVSLIAALCIALLALSHAREAERESDEQRRIAELERDKANALRTFLDRNSHYSVAVIPFTSHSSGPEQEYFATGLSRSLINDLKKIEAIDVRSYESVSKFADSGRSDAEIAKDLGVDLLVRGDVLRAGEQVQITLTLDDPVNELNFWADTYRGRWQTVFDMASDMSADMARAVELNLTQQDEQRLAKPDTTSASALEAYYKGIHNLQGANKAATDRALAFFEEAIAQDPNYAQAYLGKASAYLMKATLGERPETYNEPARAAASKALELDPTLAGAWAAIGHVRLSYDWNWDGAYEAFTRALELDPYLPAPHVGLGEYYASIGEFELAIEHIRRAVKIDQASLLLFEPMMYTPFQARRLDVAMELAQHAIDLDPDYYSPHVWMGLALAWSGDLEGGIRSLQRGYELEPESPIALAILASAYAMNGQVGEAEEKLNELLEWTGDDVNYVCPYEIATIFVALGDYQTAFDYIERAVHARSECIPFLGVDMRMDVVRNEAEYQRLMKEAGHPLHGKPLPWQPRNPERSPARRSPVG